MPIVMANLFIDCKWLESTIIWLVMWCKAGDFSGEETRSKQLADAHCDHKEKLLELRYRFKPCHNF